MNENGDLKIPNPLQSYSGLFCFINSNISNNVINISLIIVLVFIISLSNLILHCHSFNTLSVLECPKTMP